MAAKTTKKARRPAAPSHLGSEGKVLWRSIWAELPAGWVLDNREIRVLTLACEQQDDVAAVRKTLQEQGNLVEGSRGQIVMNPLLTEARQSRQTVANLLGKLALPSTEDKPETLRVIQGREAAKKRAAMAASWKVRETQNGGGSDG